MQEHIKIPRSFVDHFLYEDKPFNRVSAWLDLLLFACNKKREVIIKGSLVTLEVGQQARSEKSLARDWGWSIGKVRRFLSMLQDNRMLKQEKNHLTSIITVFDYENIKGI